MSEAAFFQTYGNVFSLYVADKRAAEERRRRHARRRAATCRSCRRRWRRWRKAAIAEALARVACLLARTGEPLPLSRLRMKQELMAEYRPSAAGHAGRSMAARARRTGDHRPLRAGARAGDVARICLPMPGDREKLVELLRRLLADARVQRMQPSVAQLAMVDQIGNSLAVDVSKRRSKGTRVRAAKPGRRLPRGGRHERAGSCQGRIASKRGAEGRRVSACKHAREVRTPARILQGVAGHAHRGGASLRREFAARRDGRGRARTDRPHPRRTEGADRGRRPGVRHRTGRNADRRRALQRGVGREGRRTGARRHRRKR